MLTGRPIMPHAHIKEGVDLMGHLLFVGVVLHIHQEAVGTCGEHTSNRRALPGACVTECAGRSCRHTMVERQELLKPFGNEGFASDWGIG